MYLQDLINQLQALRDQHGNICVLVQYEGLFGSPNGINVMHVQCDDHVVIHADDSYGMEYQPRYVS